VNTIENALGRVNELEQRRTTPDFIADSLREAILTGKLEDGERLNSVAIAHHFEVSRVPVREAIRRLEAEGLVRQEAHHRAVVSGLTLERLMELFDLRVRLECYLLERSIPATTKADLKRMTSLCDRMDAEDEHMRWLDLNKRFHELLSSRSGAELTIELSQTIRRRSMRYVYIESHGLRQQEMAAHRDGSASEEHRMLVDAVGSGEVDKAVRILAEHIESTRRLLTERILPSERDGVTA